MDTVSVSDLKRQTTNESVPVCESSSDICVID